MAHYIPLILFTVLTNFLSQIMLKKGMTSIERFDVTLTGVAGAGISILFNPFVFFGLFHDGREHGVAPGRALARRHQLLPTRFSACLSC